MRLILKNLLGLIILSVLGGVYFIGYTEKGLNIAVSLVTQKVPGQLSIRKANGKLFSHFILKNIIYADASLSINIPSLEFYWKPSGLLNDKLFIKNIVVENPTIVIKNSSSTTNTNHKNYMSWLKHIILKQFVIKNLKVSGSDYSLNFDGTLTQEWNAHWEATINNLNAFTAEASGKVSSVGKITGPLLTPEILAALQSEQLVIANKKMNSVQVKINLNLLPGSFSTFSLTAKEIDLNQPHFNHLPLHLEGEIKRSEESLEAKLKLVLAENFYVKSNLSLPKFSLNDLNQPILGTVDLSTSALEVLGHYIKDIKNPKGTLQGNLKLSGTLQKPFFSSTVHLINSSVTLPRLGISLEKINLNANYESTDSMIKYQGAFISGKGNAKFQGDFTFKDHPALSLILNGDNLKVSNLSEYDIAASPQIKLFFKDNVMDLSGKIVINHANIHLKDLSDTVTLPEEVVIIDHPKTSKELPFETTMQINLSLKEPAHFSYQDLETDLNGKIMLSQNLHGSINATGELRALNGTYNAYGQTLSIKDGRLIFTGGSLINPGLNIRATKKINTVLMDGKKGDSILPNQDMPIYRGTETLTLGVQVLGTFDNLKASLFSIPGGLSQRDILSYLTTGQAFSSQNSKQINTILLKAASAKLGKKNKLGSVTKDIQNKFGLAELDVASTETFDPTTGKVSSTTSFVVGKAITPDLYAHYSKSLFDDTQTLNLRYKLSKRLAIQSETSTINNGADLLYSIERD